MKKLINALSFLCLALGLSAQSYPVIVSGNVVDTDGSPVEGVTLYYYIPPGSNTGFTYNATLSTDVNGDFSHTADVPEVVTQGEVIITMEDCDTITWTSFGFGANVPNEFTAAFVYCANPLPSCNVYISGDSTGVGVELVANPSGTAPFSYVWSTGETTQTISIDSSIAATYCVTVMDADGCVANACFDYVLPPTCWVIVQSNPVNGLTANASGVAPFTYEWSTGETTQSINPIQAGTYCVTVTAADGCEASGCQWYAGSDPCYVHISDYGISGSTNVGLEAIPVGEGPFTFQWDYMNLQTATIEVVPTGSYCVTVTNATGCTVSDCIDLDSIGCSVEIFFTFTGMLLAQGQSLGDEQYLWSTGDTSYQILPTDPGEYCVTVTGVSGCTASDCFEYDPFTGNEVQGYILLPDSLNAANWEGTVELYQFDPSGNPELYATTEMSSTALGGYAAIYDFGNVDEGEYIIKATIDPTTPIGADHLPTYYGDVLEWDLATVVTVPSNQSWFIITMDDGQMLTGDGGINGLVTDGDNLSPNANDRGPGDPLEGISILLFDEFENSITHTTTDASGKYNFGNLPYGTYKIMVEIVGVPQGERWVTLSADEPTVSGVNFAVNENEIVNGIAELVNESGFLVFPNPASNVLNIRIESTGNFDGALNLSDLTGATILARPANIVTGVQQFSLNLGDLPTGVYFIQLTTGNEVISRRVVKQ